MPIYEFACNKCKRIYSFFSKRVAPDKQPACPRCGNPNMVKQISRFAFIKGTSKSETEESTHVEESPTSNLDDPKIQKVMSELESSIDYLDEHNPKHLAYLMKKIKEIMPADSVPPELDVAIRRLEAGEDPEKVEEEMSDALSEFLGGPMSEASSDYSTYTRDEGLYEM